MSFKNKTIVIIGGSNGIGLAAAKQFHHKNANVIISGSTTEKLTLAKDSLGKPHGKSVTTLPIDITKIESLRALSAKFKKDNTKIDTLIITAGLGKFGALETISEEDYDLVMDTNVKGSFFAVALLKEHIREGGNIILTSSFLTKQSIPSTSILTASKAAIESFTKIFAKELSNSAIRVNAISPGSVKTDFMKIANPEKETIAILKNNIPNIPLEKRADPEEIAASIVFLASEDAKYITGTILEVDGGLSIA